LVDKLPQPIEWLSDNGSPYIVGDTRTLARYIGLVPCTTPVQSPHGGSLRQTDQTRLRAGQCDARRDHVLRQLDSWFEHSNSVHPHKALGYRSPREFRKQPAEKATEDAVGAVRRPHDGTAATEAVGLRPKPPQAVARSANLDASAAVD
jgi:putative transposase